MKSDLNKDLAEQKKNIFQLDELECGFIFDDIVGLGRSFFIVWTKFSKWTRQKNFKKLNFNPKNFYSILDKLKFFTV